MIRSMTGFGSANITKDHLHLSVELKSVNSRFKEISVRLPRPLLYIEEQLKQLIMTEVQRGRVELFVSIEGESLSKHHVHINWALLDEYMEATRWIKEKYKLADINIPSALDVLNLHHVTEIKETFQHSDGLAEALVEAVEEALRDLCHMRAIEGERLKRDCIAQLECLKQCIEQLVPLSELVVKRYRERLKQRIQALVDTDLDENRLMTEVVLFADRADIAEELTRLRSHCAQFAEILTGTGPVGRKLDFLIQELNRETNTIGSKANDHEMTKIVVEMKSLIEKLKEQVQNIE